MRRHAIQFGVSGLLIVVAGTAMNLWLFRFGALAGILGLSLTKHVVVGWLCLVLGIDRGPRSLRHDRPSEVRPVDSKGNGPRTARRDEPHHHSRVGAHRRSG